MEGEKKLCDASLSIVFLFIIYTVFVMNLINPETDYSKSEKRQLYRIGGVSFDRSVSDSLELVAKDQFFARDGARALARAFSSALLLKDEVNGYTKKDGSISRIYFPPSEKGVESASLYLEKIYSEYLEKSGADIYFSLIPSKSSYAGLPCNEKKGYTDPLCKGLRNSVYVDLYGSLSSECYYATDIHWRCERIIPVAKKLCEAMDAPSEALSEVTALYVGDFFGTLSSQSLLKTDSDQLFILSSDMLNSLSVKYADRIGSVYDTDLFLCADDKYDVFMRGEVLDKNSGNNIITIENEKSNSGKTLVIFRDSFARSLAPLLMEGYERALLIDVRTPLALVMRGEIKALLDSVDSSYDVLFLLSVDMLETTVLK